MQKAKINLSIIALIFTVTVALITPMPANAAWWNPVSWVKFIIEKIMPAKKAPEANQNGDSGPKNAPAPESEENRTYRVASSSDANASNGGSGQNASSSGGRGNSSSSRDYWVEPIDGDYRGSNNSGAPSGSNNPPSGQEPCPAVYQPMCGMDNVTYGNYCELQRAGAQYNYGSACVSGNSSSSSSATTGGSAGLSTGATSGSSTESQYGSSTGTNTNTNTGSSTSTGSNAGTSADTSTPANTGTASTGGTGATVAPAFTCGLSASISQSVNLRPRPNSYGFSPIPATAGTAIKWKTDIINTGPDDMGEWRSENIGIGTRCYSTTFLQIDLGSNETWDVLKKSDLAQLRATDATWVDRFAMKSFPTWLATPGNHKWRICVDGENDIDENNETDNCVEGAINVQ